MPFIPEKNQVPAELVLGTQVARNVTVYLDPVPAIKTDVVLGSMSTTVPDTGTLSHGMLLGTFAGCIHSSPFP
jgi:hypothetical protein